MYLKYFLVLFTVTIMILSTKNHDKPLVCPIGSKPTRIIGNIALRDSSATIVLGGLVGYLIEKKPIKGMIIFIISGIFIHYITNTNTMLNYHLGLSEIPNGTGFIPNCV